MPPLAPLPPWHAEATPLLQDFLEQSAARFGAREALVCGPQRVTFEALNADADALAHWLVAQGVERGDRVLLFAENVASTVTAFWAAHKASAVVCVINPLTRADKLAYYLTDSEAKALVCDAHLLAVVNAAAPRSPLLKVVAVAGPFEPARLPSVPSAVALGQALAQGHEARLAAGGPPPRRNLDVDLAAIIYTSGSTGEPKGVMLTHRNMLTAATSLTRLLELTHEDVVLSVLPLAFNYGLYQVLLTARAGAKLVLERGFAFPAQTLKVLEAERATGFPGVPTIFAVLSELKSVAQHDLSSLRFFTNTAAALASKHIDFLASTFPRAKVYSMYGLTECKRCSYLPPEDLARKPDSVGLPIPNTELWLVDEAGQRVGPNTVGQLVVRGATVMRGYWKKPEATAEKLKAGPLPGEQVLWTGDLCRFDDEGYLYFVARMDDIIKSRGEKVAPREVEAALLDIDGVREAAVVGVPDEVLGQAVKAFVALQPGVTLSEKDVTRACAARLEPFMVPRSVVFLDELPKTSTGKVTKAGLR